MTGEWRRGPVRHLVAACMALIEGDAFVAMRFANRAVAAVDADVRAAHYPQLYRTWIFADEAEFLRHWWLRVRCRLAVANVERIEFGE